nr:AlNc14C36G3228 [Albugo laibachii Nc14]CCA27843.1 AlNc14C735G12461 [Albugo laibachii Nc14]|eukprot:CCA27843.1 AlNc14C735G12461 [Albugo laibachii Nc14]
MDALAEKRSFSCCSTFMPATFISAGNANAQVYAPRFRPMSLLYFLDPPIRENHALQLRVGNVAASHTRVLRIFSGFERIVSHVTSGIYSSSQGSIQNTRARQRNEQHTY